jgi:uncharacterized membrane protein YkgB
MSIAEWIEINPENDHAFRMKAWILDGAIAVIGIILLVICLLVFPALLTPGYGYIAAIIVFIIVLSYAGFRYLEIAD